MVEVDDLRRLADVLTAGMPPGDPLTELEAALVELGVAVSVTSLDRRMIETAIANAFTAGATTAQVQEIVSLISGLGVHSLMVSATVIVEQAAHVGIPVQEDLTSAQQALWDRHVGEDPFWTGFERELPGFLRSMLRLSPDQFVAFFHYCAVPWNSGTVRARVKELIAMASDAAPTHRFRPGFRLHLANAIALGASRAAIEQALDIAAAAPPHRGTD